jgi:hypothetical protein
MRPEFVRMLTQESADACEATKKLTISPDHVIQALKVTVTPHSVSCAIVFIFIIN